MVADAAVSTVIVPDPSRNNFPRVRISSLSSTNRIAGMDLTSPVCWIPQDRIPDFFLYLQR
jgi:hypothetical protein